MKAFSSLAVMAALFLATSPCPALQEIMEVSPARAKELGVTIRSNPNGESGVRVELEFQPKGVLKNFMRVELEITVAGKRVVDAMLQTTRAAGDTVTAQFSADPVYLATSALTIVVQDGERTRIGYEFKVNDFLKPGVIPGEAVLPNYYETVAQIKAMPPCTVTVVHAGTRWSLLKTADGRQFCLGSPGAAQEVWNFLATLKQGQTFELPGAFLEHLKQTATAKPADNPPAGAKQPEATTIPSYITAAQIMAMAPVKATVEHKETFTARLRTADGKLITLGSDRGAQEVWHFVGTALKTGQTYELPAAFLAYQQRKFYVTADEVKAMPAGRATLELRGPCFSIFRGTDGKQFVIGNPGSGAEVWKFLGTLEEGQTYELPRAFLDYHKPKQ